jgi:hypothetical protein
MAPSKRGPLAMGFKRSLEVEARVSSMKTGIFAMKAGPQVQGCLFQRIYGAGQ